MISQSDTTALAKGLICLLIVFHITTPWHCVQFDFETKIRFALQFYYVFNEKKGQIELLCCLCISHTKSRHPRSLRIKRPYVAFDQIRNKQQ